MSDLLTDPIDQPFLITDYRRSPYASKTNRPCEHNAEITHDTEKGIFYCSGCNANVPAYAMALTLLRGYRDVRQKLEQIQAIYHKDQQFISARKKSTCKHTKAFQCSGSGYHYCPSCDTRWATKDTVEVQNNPMKIGATQ